MKRIISICKSSLFAILPLFMLAACEQEGDVIQLKVLDLETNAVEVGKGFTKNVDIYSGNGTYSVTSADKTIATGVVRNGVLEITGVAKGSTTITLKDELLKKTGTVNVTVVGLGLSADVRGVVQGQSRSFDVLYGSGDYEVTPSNDVITAFRDGKTISINGTKAGESELTIKDKVTKEELKIQMKVCEAIAIDRNSVELFPGDSEIINVTAGSGTYEVISDNPAVVTGSTDGSVATLQGVSIGSAKVPVVIRDVITGSQISVEAQVTDNKISLQFSLNGIDAQHVLMMNAPRLYRPDVWFDLDGNGQRSTAESITEFGTYWEYNSLPMYIPTATNVNLFGKVDYFGRSPGTETSLWTLHEIESADFSKNPYIKDIYLPYGMLKSINTTGCTLLETLEIPYNNHALLSLDVSTNTALKYIGVSDFGGTSLDFSGLTELEVMYCMNATNLKTIKFQGHNKLMNLNAGFCGQLESIIGLSECVELIEIHMHNDPADGNGIPEIDLSGNPKLTIVDLSSNKLTSPIIFSENAAGLQKLHLYNCDMADPVVQATINSIPAAAKATITTLELRDNKIEKLDLTGFTSLKTINIQHNKISEEEALKLMESLPRRTRFDGASIIVADKTVGLAEGVEGNHFSKAAVSVATGKYWSVQAIFGPNTLPFSGEE